MSNRIVVYKHCKYHNENMARLVDEGQAECSECRHLTFRASMKARGISVTVPTYKGGYSITSASYQRVTDKPGLRDAGVFAFPDRIPGR